jgi:hypothetical protein
MLIGLALLALWVKVRRRQLSLQVSLAHYKPRDTPAPTLKSA